VKEQAGVSLVHWLTAERDLDRLRPDPHRQIERADFEGLLVTFTISAAAEVPPPTEVAAPLDCRSVLEQIVVRVSDCGSDISLQWETAELGRLQIEISREGDQVQVSLVTDDAHAASLLERHAALLGEMLADEGLQLVRYSVLPTSPRRVALDSERNDPETEINSLLGVIRGASSR
jgi:hypothetical protein